MPLEDTDYPDFDDSSLIMKAQREFLKFEARASPKAQRIIEQENEDVDTPDIELEALLFRAKQSVKATNLIVCRCYRVSNDLFIRRFRTCEPR